MKALLLPLALICSTALAAAPIDTARGDYASYKVNEAERQFRDIATDPRASASDRGQAEVALARIEWLVDNNASEALNRLKRSLPRDPQPCAAARLYSRILNESGKAADVPARLKPYASRCAALEPQLAIEILRSRILVAASRPAAARRQVLADARTRLAKLPPLTRAYLDAARAAMDIGLLARDGGEALDGWRDYFWLEGTNRPTGLSATNAEIAESFKRGAKARADNAAVTGLVALLVRTGFAEEAGWMIRDHRVKPTADQRWRAIEAYFAMRKRLVLTILAHDRSYARTSKEDVEGFQKQIVGILSAGVRAAGGAAGESLWPALEKLWGIHGQTGVINGVSGLMLGHAVEDRRATIAQGARRGEIRFVVLDNMIENSFSSWLWDTGAGPGGWAKDGKVIYQIRPGYAGQTLKVLSQTLPGPARDEMIERMQKFAEADEAKLRNGVDMPLPGVAARLQLQAADRMAADLRAQARTGATFIQMFRRAWWDATIESSIVLHEGRHVLDQAEYKGLNELSGKELEYRGKISEVGYSKTPRLGLSSILSMDVPADSSHGNANIRIVRLYRDWIAAHKREIAGFDLSEPALLQIDKLTDEQLRQVVLRADPETPKPEGAGA